MLRRLWKNRNCPSDFRESSWRFPDSRSEFFFWLRSIDGRATRLPTVVVDEVLNRLPFGMTEFDGWISEIDKTSYLNVFRDP